MSALALSGHALHMSAFGGKADLAQTCGLLLDQSGPTFQSTGKGPHRLRPTERGPLALLLRGGFSFACYLR